MGQDQSPIDILLIADHCDKGDRLGQIGMPKIQVDMVRVWMEAIIIKKTHQTKLSTGTELRKAFLAFRHNFVPFWGASGSFW